MGLLLTAEELFQIAIQLESYGQSYYLELADQITDPKLSELFDSLAGEEEQHYKQFTDYYKQATQKDWQISKVDEETVDYIEALLGVRMFPPDKDVSMQAAAVHSTRDVLNTALAMEKDALLFYRELVEMISSELCPAVRMIINEERNHITRLQEMLDSTPA
jgi:rubrerythrin